MSLIPLGTSVAAAALEGFISAVLIRPRSIGGFIADVTVEEHMEDEVEMTHIPVETGAQITDHAFKRPARVTIRAGWSNSSFQAFGNPVYDQITYDAFLALQASLIPFTVITGKRIYNNMLARRVSATTTEATENALMMTVECQEIIFVTTQQVKVPPAANMANAPANAPINDVGPKIIGPAPLWN